MSEAPRAETSAPRYAFIDLARGLALVAMAIYHGIWDLGFFQLVPADVPSSPPMRLFAQAIGSSFLLLSGAGLVLATRRGFVAASFLKRLAKIVAAAALVSVATYYAFPESFIHFGILHHIAVASVVALAFLHAPVWLTLAIAIVAFVLPHVAANEALNAPLVQWLGLGTREPRTNDWWPILPWFAMTLAGVALMKLALPRISAGLASWTPGNAGTRGLVFAGRHSLLVYLVHQPVLLLVLFVVSRLIVSPVPVADEAGFIRSCTAQCVAQKSERAYCARVCACIPVEAKGAGLWSQIQANKLNADEYRRFADITQICTRMGSEQLR